MHNNTTNGRELPQTLDALSREINHAMYEAIKLYREKGLHTIYLETDDGLTAFTV